MACFIYNCCQNNLSGFVFSIDLRKPTKVGTFGFFNLDVKGACTPDGLIAYE